MCAGGGFGGFSSGVGVFVGCFHLASSPHRAKTGWCERVSSLAVAMATSVPKQQLPWTTAKLVPEALHHKLYVLEDPGLIALLGRAKFVEMVVFGVAGWQKGVSHLFAHFFLRIQFCKDTHSNLHVICLYLPAAAACW